jgi:hypothetical protein
MMLRPNREYAGLPAQTELRSTGVAEWEDAGQARWEGKTENRSQNEDGKGNAACGLKCGNLPRRSRLSELLNSVFCFLFSTAREDQSETGTRQPLGSDGASPYRPYNKCPIFARLVWR